MWVHRNSATGYAVVVLALDPGQRVRRWRANRSASSGRKFEHDGAAGELVVGGVQEPFDGLGAERAVELGVAGGWPRCAGRAAGRWTGLAAVAGGHGDRSWSLRSAGSACTAGVEAGDAVGELVDDGVERGRCRRGTGSGIDQCSAGVWRRPVASSSWALSQTVTTRSAGSRTSCDVAGRCGRRGRGVAAGDGDRAGMHACVRGGCPRRWPGPGCASFHIAAASCERAELCGAHEHHPLRRGRPGWAAGRRGRRGRARGSCGDGRLRTGAGSPARRSRARAGGGPAGSTAIPSRGGQLAR